MDASRTPLAVDLFCGAGGLSLGFQQAGFKIVGGFDFDPVHVRTHSANFPESIDTCVDLRGLTGTRIREALGLQQSSVIDVVIGGPPCQGFSMIGKRDMKDPRNLLLGDFCRLVAELGPRFFVMENVAGLIYGAARKHLATCLCRLRKDGYRWVTPIRVLDSAQFGVPQRRRRVVIIGYRAAEPRPKYPVPSTRIVTVKQAIGDLRVLGNQKKLFKSDIYSGKLGRPSCYARDLRQEQVELTGCLRVVHSPEVRRRFRSTRPGSTELVSRFPRLHESLTAPTLRAGTSCDHGSFTAVRPIHPTQSRCITVREAARLHSFPDSFRFNSTNWHGFRQIGNAVPPKLAYAIARCLKVVIRPKDGEAANEQQ